MIPQTGKIYRIADNNIRFPRGTLATVVVTQVFDPPWYARGQTVEVTYVADGALWKHNFYEQVGSGWFDAWKEVVP
jgi:hypothetical protein